MYHTKESEDSCGGHGGGDILEMREIGMDAYSAKAFDRMLEQLGNLSRKVK